MLTILQDAYQAAGAPSDAGGGTDSTFHVGRTGLALADTRHNLTQGALGEMGIPRDPWAVPIGPSVPGQCMHPMDQGLGNDPIPLAASFIAFTGQGAFDSVDNLNEDVDHTISPGPSFISGNSHTPGSRPVAMPADNSQNRLRDDGGLRSQLFQMVNSITGTLSDCDRDVSALAGEAAAPGGNGERWNRAHALVVPDPLDRVLRTYSEAIERIRQSVETARDMLHPL